MLARSTSTVSFHSILPQHPSSAPFRNILRLYPFNPSSHIILRYYPAVLMFAPYHSLYPSTKSFHSSLPHATSTMPFRDCFPPPPPVTVFHELHPPCSSPMPSSKEHVRSRGEPLPGLSSLNFFLTPLTFSTFQLFKLLTF